VTYIADGICMAYLNEYMWYKREEVLRANVLWSRHANNPKLRWVFTEDTWQGLYIDGKEVR
jgi:hypothetical protein